MLNLQVRLDNLICDFSKVDLTVIKKITDHFRIIIGIQYFLQKSTYLL